MKLSKPQMAAQKRCLEILKQDVLSEADKEFVFMNYHEGAVHMNASAGAFFTPFPMAWQFSNEVILSLNGDHVEIIDLCAGIGILSYPILYKLKAHGMSYRLVCVEFNKDYLEVGKKLIPEAEWHQLDVTDVEAVSELGFFDMAISNPPFGSVATFRDKKTPRYTGGHAEYKVIDVAYQVADHGLFLLPQESAGFKFSGRRQYSDESSAKYKSFVKSTGLELELGMSVDTSVDDMYQWEDLDGRTVDCGWKGVNPVVEFANCPFSDYRPKVKQKTTLF